MARDRVLCELGTKVNVSVVKGLNVYGDILSEFRITRCVCSFFRF
jgi:hypothetical protein